MATQVDPLRSTLDTLHLSPEAKADRPYLITMLRRLGYSEVEIRHYLGEEAAAPADEGGDRLIELEYTGPGLRDYLVVVPPEEGEFGVDPLGLGEGLEAGEEVFAAGPSMEEVDALVAQSDISDWDDWGEGAPSAEEANKDIAAVDGGGEAGELTAVEMDEELESIPGLEPMEGEAAIAGAEELVFEEAGAPGDFGEFQDPARQERLRLNRIEHTDEPESEEIVEFGITPEPMERPGEPQDPVWTEFHADSGGEPAGPGPALPAGAEPYQFQDWTLYSRDVELSSGRPQRIYFFSKGEPQSGVPSALPQGYEVAVNDRTGLPFLRRIEPGDLGEHPDDLPSAFTGDVTGATAPRRRVRILRVRGASREEAERKVSDASPDRRVIASMPVDITGGTQDE